MAKSIKNQNNNPPDIIPSSLYDENTLDNLVLFGIQLVGANYGSILIINDGTKEIEIISFRSNKETDGLLRKGFSQNEGIGGHVVKHKKPYICPDVSKDPNYLQFISDYIKSEIAIPILLNNELMGIAVFDSIKKQKFNNNHLEKIKTLSPIIAKALYEYKVNRARKELDDDMKRDIAFIIMPFREPFDKYYTSIIQPTVRSLGLRPLRVDEIYGPTQIIKDIWLSVKKSKLIIAELTSKNPNVMYELGLGHAINKPVIMLSQTLDDVPFDLKSYRCIIYNTSDPDWADRLKDHIRSHILAILQGQAVGPFDDSN